MNEITEAAKRAAKRLRDARPANPSYWYFHKEDEKIIRDEFLSVTAPLEKERDDWKIEATLVEKCRNDCCIERDSLLAQVSTLEKQIEELTKERDAYAEGVQSQKRDANEWFSKWEANEAEKLNLQQQLTEANEERLEFAETCFIAGCESAGDTVTRDYALSRWKTSDIKIDIETNAI